MAKISNLNELESTFHRAYAGLCGFEENFETNDHMQLGAAVFYGELTFRGTEQMLSTLSEITSYPETKSDIIFLDLGSGLGKATVQAFLSSNLLISKAVGIELGPKRHALAECGKKRVETELKLECLENVFFLRGNILELDQVWLNDIRLRNFLPTHIFFSVSKLMDTDLVFKVLERIEIIGENLRYLVTMIDLEDISYNRKTWGLVTTVEVETTWAKTDTIWIYRRSST